MCQRFDVTGDLKNFAKFYETKQGLSLSEQGRSYPVESNQV
jgi:hypothetical protein